MSKLALKFVAGSRCSATTVENDLQIAHLCKLTGIGFDRDGNWLCGTHLRTRNILATRGICSRCKQIVRNKKL